MKRKTAEKYLFRGLICLLICAVVGVGVFLTTYLSMKKAADQRELEIAKSYQQTLDSLMESVGKDETLYYMQRLVSSYFYGEPGEWTADAPLDGVYRSFIDSLNDPYAAYYSPSEYQAEISDRKGSRVGIGVQVNYDEENQNIRILLVVPGSPAETAGLLAGDRIVAVDGNRVEQVGYTAATDAITGEAGVDVRLTLLRQDKEIEISVTRNSFVNVSVYGSLCSDGQTGLIRMTGFDDATPGQFAKAVDDLLAAGAKRLVFDLRDNGGGSLNSVLSVLSYLIEKDQTLIRIYDKQNNVTTYASDNEHTVDCPMAVLINHNTASAAELFSACLRELKSALLVGEKSYGKGCMQAYYNLPNGGGMKMTNKMYNPPSDVSYHGVGLIPDRTVESDPAYSDTPAFFLTEEQDLQLQAALAALSESGT